MVTTGGVGVGSGAEASVQDERIKPAMTSIFFMGWVVLIERPILHKPILHLGYQLFLIRVMNVKYVRSVIFF